MATDAPERELVERLREMCIDWTGEPIVDESIPRYDPDCKTLRAAADAIESLLADKARLKSAVTELGKCGSCGGTGNYLNKGWQRDVFRVQEITCSKCSGTGVNPIARAALTRSEP